MSPKVKADEIFDKLSWAMVPDGQSVRTAAIIKHAKKCAIICVEQIIAAAIAIDDKLESYEGVRIQPQEYWGKVLECLKQS